MRFQEWNAKEELRKSNRARAKTRNFFHILHKRLCMQMAKKWRLLVICLISVIFLPILVVIRNIGQAMVVPKRIFDDIAIDNLDKMRSDLAHIQNISNLKFVEKIAFAPNTMPFELIIAKAVNALKMEGYVGVNTSSELELMVREKHFMAGVLFLVDNPYIKSMPSNLDFVLRFPPTLRTSPQKSERFWPTRNLYTELIELVTGKPDSRSTKDANYGNVPPGYIQEGFIALQHAISMAYIELYAHLSISELPKIYMSRYPLKRYIYDRLFVSIKLLLPIAVMFSYSYSNYKMAFFITDETELGIMKGLKVEWLNCCAWFVVLFLLQLLITLLSLFILSSCGWDQDVWDHSNLITILLFMLTYLVSNVTFTLMICHIVVHQSRSAITVVIVHFLTYLPFPLIFVLYYDLSLLRKLLSCLILNTGLAMGLNIILDFERTAEGLSWGKFDYTNFAGSELTLLHVMQMLLLSSVIHILILIYAEGRRSASDVASMYVDVEAQPAPWTYPFQSMFKRWKKQQEIKILTNTLPRPLPSDASLRIIRTNEHNSTNRDTTTQISFEALNLDVDVAVYQKYQRRKKPYKSSWPPKATSSDHLFKLKRNDQRLKALTKSYSVEDLTKSSKRNVSLLTTNSSINTVQSMPLVSQYSTELDSSSSSYDFFLDGYPSRSVFSIENEELANVAEGISVINVSKSFQGIEYLSNITMTIHPKEVTVILGQRGAGKMLLGEIIAGTVKMTSGRVVVNGMDISEYKSGKNFDQPFAIMPKQEITFSLLTVKENLYFYAYLRGMRNQRQIAREIRKYLAKLDMPELQNTPVSQLTYGANRCLGFCCAMCGGNHGIILDEPTLGLDEYGCHSIWDMIKMEGYDRTIIVCTQRHEDAVILANRIAVLNWGSLQCYGETQRLLKTYCAEYYLNCKKKPEGKKNEALAMMNRYVSSGLQVRVNNRKQLNVRISDGNEVGLSLILKELEHKTGSHNIENFTLFRQTLRDVFMQNNEKRYSLPNSTVANILEFEPDKGKRRFFQIKAIMLIKILYLKKSGLMPLFLLCLIVLAIIFDVSPQGTEYIHLPHMDITLCRYKNSHVISKANPNIRPNMISHKLVAIYKNFIERSPTNCENIYHAVKGRRELISYILAKQQISYLRVETFYAAAIDFYADKIICFWNSKLLHSAPISINLLHNALLQYSTNSRNATIKVANHPFKFSHADFLNLNTLQKDTHLNIGTIPFLLFLTGVSLYTLHIVHDLSSGRMVQELMAGVSHQMFWTTRFLWDFAMYNVVIIVIVVVLVIHDASESPEIREYSDTTMVVLMFMIFEIFGLAVLPFIYCLSFLFKSNMLGYLVTLLILTGTSLLPAETLPGIERVLDINIGFFFLYMLYWSPSAVLLQCLRRLHILGAIKHSIQQVCDQDPSLCGTYKAPSYFSLSYPGIILPFFMLTVLAALYTLLFNKIFQSIVCRVWIKKSDEMKGKQSNSIKTFKNTLFDKDVFLENERVRLMEDKDRSKLALVFDDVFNPNHLMGVSFAIKHREVFGIVGRFGSGKSKILEVTAGRDIIEKGDVYVYGNSVRENRKEAFKYLGYCPKQNALHEFLTVKELLYFYCRLCGRKTSETKELIDWLVTLLRLGDKLNVHISDLVFANCRKLSIAIAVISSTQVIMIDEPTRGMGPEGCQLISQMINLIHQTGRTVVLAMESLEDCMPLCERICILVNGRLECIGTVDHLMQKFSRGCILQVYVQRKLASLTDLRNSAEYQTRNSAKTERSSGSSGRSFRDDSSNNRYYNQYSEIPRIPPQYSDSNEDPNFWTRIVLRYDNFSEFMETELPYARLEEEYSNMLVYYIPFNMLPLSQVFFIMEAGKNSLNVDNYKVWRPSILDMYEHFTKQNCRFWGKPSPLSKRSLGHLLSVTTLQRNSTVHRVKRLFKKQKR